MSAKVAKVNQSFLPFIHPINPFVHLLSLQSATSDVATKNGQIDGKKNLSHARAMPDPHGPLARPFDVFANLD